uniref:ANK_REP_REGION domain-containing protein n=1 Tax=Trichobilharzia regenti TaxID=157069 RepID=A0AA85JAL4_TRIRE|nr:unnamed protein product [Trichobilharzia regenti]
MHDMDSVQFECQQFRSANPTMVTDMSRNPKILRTRVFTSTKFLVVNKKFNSQLYHNRTLDIIFTMSPVTTEDTNNGMEEQVVVSKNYINNKLLLQQGIIEVNTMDSAGLQMNLEDNTRIHEINIPRIFLTQNLNPFEWSQVLSNCMNISPEIIKQAWFQMISSKSVNSRLIDLCINSLKQISVNLVDEIVNIADKRGNTALHYAISQANWPIVYTLMNNSTKTDVNKFNRAGYTPLMMAAMWISKNGRTALEIAIAKQNYLIALLIYAKIQVQRLNTSYYRFA